VARNMDSPINRMGMHRGMNHHWAHNR
jgi:hypothetical protein